MYIYKTKLSTNNFLKNSENPIAKRYIDEINSSCDKYRRATISTLLFSKFRLYEESGERSTYQRDYFDRRRRLSMFLLRVWLWGEERDIRELEDILFSVCDEYTWAIPAHLCGILKDSAMTQNKVDLFAAETAHTVAEALSLCGELLHPAVVRRCINEVFKRVIEPFESQESEKYGLWWERHPNNWAAVCGGSLGMAALYLIEDEARLRKITERAKASCTAFLDSCKDDGVCLEGVTYWSYATQYYVAFDELLYERLGERIPRNEEKMKRLASFPSIACLGGGISVKFSDCSDTHLFYGILCKLHERYAVSLPEDSYYTHIIDRCARTCGAVRSIAWFNPDATSGNTAQSNVFLPDAEWAVMRQGDMTLAVKGGHNDEPHNHNDVGSFMFVRNGVPLADELGAPKYEKDYFSDKRYDYLAPSSHGHSLPIVNGYRQSAGKEYRADGFEIKDKAISISFAKAYPQEAGLTSLARKIFIDGEGLTVTDSFKFSTERNSVCERIITKLDAAIIDDSHVSLSNGKEVLGIIEFSGKGNLHVINESYTVPNSSGKSDEYSTKEIPTPVYIIEFECGCDSVSMEISYRIK